MYVVSLQQQLQRNGTGFACTLTVLAYFAKHVHQQCGHFLGLQVRSEQLAEEHTELVALRHELNQRDREQSRRATEQATEAANTQVSIFAQWGLTAACLLGLMSLRFAAAAAALQLVA